MPVDAHTAKTREGLSISLASVILAILAAVAPLAAVAASAAGADWYALDLQRGVLEVSTDYYNLTFNLTRGATLYSATLTYGGESVNPLEPARWVPSLFLYAYSNTSPNTPGESRVEFSYGNETFTASYPGLLAVKPWNASVVYADNETLVVELQPGPEAASDVYPVNVLVHVRFYRHLPLIDYTVTFTNPSSGPVRLYSVNSTGSEWGPLVELVAGSGSPADWNVTVLYTIYTGGVELVSSNETNYTIDLQDAYTVDAVALVKSSGNARYLVALEPNTKPMLAQLVKGFEVIGEAVRVRLVYPSLTLEPGGSYTIKLRLAMAWWDPGALSLAGLAGLYYKVSGAEQLRQVYEYSLAIGNLTSRIDELQLQLNLTRTQLEDATRRAGEAEGLLSICRADYNYTAAQLEYANAMVKRSGEYIVASLLAGLALGLAGYRFAVQPLLESRRRRRR